MKSIRNAFLALTAVMLSGAASDVVLNTSFVVPAAQAVIGRPLTPISYAGVARRTTMRIIYVSTVRVTTLPVGCTTVVINGTSLQSCGGSYYQPSGGEYILVKVQ